MKYSFMHDPVPDGQRHPGNRLCSQKGVWIHEDIIGKRKKTKKTQTTSSLRWLVLKKIFYFHLHWQCYKNELYL